MRSISLLAAAVILAALLCACEAPGKEEQESPVPKYTAKELGITSSSGSQGIYILNEDETFSPLVKDFDGYGGLSKEDSLTRYLWFTENSGEVLDRIPHFTQGCSLVLLYNTEEAIPDALALERYEYKGYTIGAHMYKSEDAKLYLCTRGCLEDTYAASSLSKVSDEEEYPITDVNESADLPFKNIDNNMRMLLGLEGGKQYLFGLYKGTKYFQFKTIADTQVFQSMGTEVIPENYYERTTKGYFVINLPKGLGEGYYYVTGLGMMYYEGKQ